MKERKKELKMASLLLFLTYCAWLNGKDRN